jgi:hypothetical protein
MHFDAYAAGKHAGFEGSECYLLGCYGTTGFACMEPISHASATSFSSAIMKILLRYGFCHTAVLDKDATSFTPIYSSAGGSTISYVHSYQVRNTLLQINYLAFLCQPWSQAALAPTAPCGTSTPKPSA